MELSFGARLRLRREQQKIALATIADATKIRASLLEQLERDDLSQWPAGIFRRSYVRTYAQAIGLDPEAIVREFLQLYPDPVEEETTAAVAAAKGISRRPPSRLGLLIDSAMGGAFSRAPDAAPKVADAVPTKSPSPDADVAPGVVWPPLERKLSEVAQLCVRLSRAVEQHEVVLVLKDAVGILNAVGAVVWTWDSRASALIPGIAHGYPAELVARLPRVRRDGDNAIGAAFRCEEMQVTSGVEGGTGSVVVPLMTPSGCAGVFAVELRSGGEQSSSVRALLLVLAAQLSALVECAPVMHAATA